MTTATVAHLAAALLAVDPVGLGGAVVRGPIGPECDAWLAELRTLLPADTPWRRMPPQVAEARLLGGLDLAATLAAGRPVAERGLIAAADGGILVVPMAERLAVGPASHLAAALDTSEVIVERDGLALRHPARVATVLLDEGIDDERTPEGITERVAFCLDVGRTILPRATGERDHPKGGGGGGRGFEAERERLPSNVADIEASQPPPPPSAVPLPRFAGEDIAAARARLAGMVASNDIIAALAAAGLAFGVPSLRLAVLALRVARASAALAGREAMADEDAQIAAALVIAPRATTLPETQDDENQAESQTPPPDPETAPDNTARDESEAKTLEDRVLEATRAAIPADLLATLAAAASLSRQGTGGGRAGATRKSLRRGRPAGVRRGAPGHGARLAIVETLRAAAPWQRLRRQTTPDAASRVLVRREDFRVGRFKEKSETLTIFAVDASGSAALHRLAEVKGAVELILAECYVRRDCVALIAFRGDRAELVLPPTRSLARAKRALAGQPGGGGTPLAAAIDASTLLAQAARKKGQTPLVVLMTDGKANISRDGRPGRSEAEADASAAAKAFRLAGAAGLVLDIAPRPGPAASRLAADMGARYIPLPYADAQLVSRAVLAATP